MYIVKQYGHVHAYYKLKLPILNPPEAKSRSFIHIIFYKIPGEHFYHLKKLLTNNSVCPFSNTIELFELGN
jgi:hypothetical protein